MHVEIIIDKEQNVKTGTLSALESELYKRLMPAFPETKIRIRQGTMTVLDVTGKEPKEDKDRARQIIQSVWEDDSWL